LSDLYPYIFETLGKSEEDPAFRQLKGLVGEPGRVYEVGSLRSLAFTSYGFSLDYSTKYRRFCGLSFHTKNSKAVERGEFRPYSGHLHAGIEPSDTRAVIEHKIGTPPSSRSNIDANNKSGKQCDDGSCYDRPYYRDKYKLPDYHLLFYFDASDGVLTFAAIAEPQFFHQ